MAPCVTCSFYAMIPLMFDKNLLNQGDSSFEYNEITSSGWWVRGAHNLFLMYPDFRPHLKGPGQHPTLSFPDYPAF